MRHALLALLVLAACSSKKSSEPELKPADPKPVETKPAEPAPTPVETKPAEPAAWEVQTRAFMTSLASVVETSNGDCLKLTEGLEKLEPAAAELKATLTASGHKAEEVKPDAAFETTMNKDPKLFDRCLKEAEAKKDKRLEVALDKSLFTVVPMFSDEFLKAAGEAFGHATAVH